MSSPDREDALRRLELRMHRVELLAVFAVFTALLVIVMGQTSVPQDDEEPAVVQASELKLVDRNGHLRIRLRATEEGGEIALYDDADKASFLLSSAPDGVGASFYIAGSPRIGFAAGRDQAEFLLFGERKPRLWLLTKTGGAASFGVYDEEGRGRIAIGSSKDDTSVTLYDANANPRAILGTTSKLEERRPESSLFLLDEAGKRLWSAP